jgi:hypothetical protein
LLELIKTVKNWPSVLLLYVGLRQNIEVVFRNNVTVKVADKSKWYLIYYLTKISLNSCIIHKPNGTFKVVLDNSEVILSLTDEVSIYRAFILSYLYKELNIKFHPDSFCELYFRGKKGDVFL